MKKEKVLEWSTASNKQKRKMLEEEVTKANCGKKLILVRKISSISRRELAEKLAVSEATVRRIEAGISKPTDEFMNRVHALCVLGIAKFGKLSKTEKKKVSESLGAAGGIVAGVGGAIGAISASGAVAGLSAAGITSGLAALGGGAMVSGIAVVAAIPVLTGLAGYGLVKGIKKICEKNELECREVNRRWEITTTKKGAKNGKAGKNVVGYIESDSVSNSSNSDKRDIR